MKIKHFVGACVAAASMALMSVAAQAAVYSVETVNASNVDVGKPVEVKILAEANKGAGTENINGFAVKITYDSTYLDPQKADAADATGADCYATTPLDGGVLVADKTTSSDSKPQIAIAWAKSEPITVNEGSASVLAVVKFNIVKKDTDVTDINIEVVDQANSSTSKGTYAISDTTGGVKFKVSVKLGDVNLDGSIDVDDVSMLTNHVVKMSTLVDDNFTAADINEDGKVDVDDLSALINHVVGIKLIG